MFTKLLSFAAWRGAVRAERASLEAKRAADTAADSIDKILEAGSKNGVKRALAKRPDAYSRLFEETFPATQGKLSYTKSERLIALWEQQLQISYLPSKKILKSRSFRICPEYTSSLCSTLVEFSRILDCGEFPGFEARTPEDAQRLNANFYLSHGYSVDYKRPQNLKRMIAEYKARLSDCNLSFDRRRDLRKISELIYQGLDLTEVLERHRTLDRFYWEMEINSPLAKSQEQLRLIDDSLQEIYVSSEKLSWDY